MGPPPLAPFPHHAWLGYWEHVPADGHRRTLIGEHNPAHDYFTLLIPRRAAGILAESEGTIWTFDDLNCFVFPRDQVLRWCMERLSVPPSGMRDMQLRKDEAARRLLFRLQELSGGGVPDWQSDGSSFDRAEMQRFVDYIDDHLQLAPTLSAMGLMAALSPSHFAKKFRQSAGLSLQRFINRRRILASIRLLQKNAAPSPRSPSTSASRRVTRAAHPPRPSPATRQPANLQGLCLGSPTR